MSKIVAIDYGIKRVGVAITDSSKKIAFALNTIPNDEIFIYLNELVKKQKISTIVVGNPINLQNRENDISINVSEFIDKLNQNFPAIEIKKIDERYTSVIAKKTILSSGISQKKRRNKSLVDKISATIILQDFIERLA